MNYPRFYSPAFFAPFCLLAGFLALFSRKTQAQQAPFRIAVAGMTHGHVHQVLRRGQDADIEIVGFWEPNQELAGRLLKQYGYSEKLLFDDLDAMLAATRPESVAAFNDIFGHLAVVAAAAPRGIHVMVEKPLAVSLDHAQRMAKLARENNIHLLTNYETTWYGSNALLGAMVDSGRVGEIRKMVIHDGHKGPIEIGCNPEFLDWLTDPKRNGGGAITDFGCYGADLMTWLMKGKRPISVMAVTQQIKPDRYPHVDDEATIIVQYPQAQGIIQASWNWPISRKDTEVYGQTGYVHTIDGSRMRQRMAEGDPESTLTAPALPAPVDDPFRYLAAVVRGTWKPAQDLSSLEINLVAMEILDAAIRSARQGKVIQLGK